MPHVQWEQHQPVKSSPSTQIKRLFIHLPFVRAFWDSCSDAAGRNTSTDRARKVDSCPPENIFHGIAIGQSDEWGSSRWQKARTDHRGVLRKGALGEPYPQPKHRIVRQSTKIIFVYFQNSPAERISVSGASGIASA